LLFEGNEYELLYRKARKYLLGQQGENYTSLSHGRALSDKVASENELVAQSRPFAAELLNHPVMYSLSYAVYYLTPEDKPERPLKHINLQELSLLKSYLTICLQAILDPLSFEVSKKNPKPHYLTNTIDELSRYPAVPTRQINELRVLEGRSDHIVQKNMIRPLKGIIID
jgi:hypothetical protein